MYQYLIILAFSLLSCSLNAVAFDDNKVSASKIYILDIEQASQTQVTDIDVEDSVVNKIKPQYFSFDNQLVLTGYQLPRFINAHSAWSIRAPPQITS